MRALAGMDLRRFNRIVQNASKIMPKCRPCGSHVLFANEDEARGIARALAQTSGKAHSWWHCPVADGWHAGVIGHVPTPSAMERLAAMAEQDAGMRALDETRVAREAKLVYIAGEKAEASR